MRIGDFEPRTNLFLAPVAGYTDVSFRLVVRSIGGLGLAATDLLNPHGLLRQTEHSMRLAETCPEDRPLCMQIYGREPDLMAEAARWSEAHGARTIDINMGCPADKVVKKDAGVALMGLPRLAARITAEMVRAVRAPVTVKMRLGCTAKSCNAPELARRLVDVGAAAITIHGRTGEQRFKGSVDVPGIAAVVKAVGDQVPVIGNGDLKSPTDAAAMIEQTGCAGLMIARQALRDPWIFRDVHAYLNQGVAPPAPTPHQRVAVIREHFSNLRRYRGDRVAVLEFRQRISMYARMLPRSRQLRQQMNRIDSVAEFHDILGAYLEQVATEGESTCGARQQVSRASGQPLPFP